MTSVFGPLITTRTVERALEATVRLWINDYLAEIERRSAGRWRVAQIIRPRCWEVVSDIRNWPDRKLPAVIIEAQARVRDASGGGQVNGQFGYLITVIAKGKSREETRDTVLDTAEAIAWLLEQKGSLGGLASDTVAGEAVYDAVRPELARTTAGARLAVVVSVPNVTNRFAGPDAPTPPDEPPPDGSPQDPLHTETNVTLTALDANEEAQP